MWVFVPELKRSRITLVEWDLEGKFLLVVQSRFNLFQGFLGMSRLHWVFWIMIPIAQWSICRKNGQMEMDRSWLFFYNIVVGCH